MGNTPWTMAYTLNRYFHRLENNEFQSHSFKFLMGHHWRSRKTLNLIFLGQKFIAKKPAILDRPKIDTILEFSLLR